MSRYVLTAEAQDDLRQIRDYVLDEGGFRAARYVVGSLVTGFRALAGTPGQGTGETTSLSVKSFASGLFFHT